MPLTILLQRGLPGCLEEAQQMPRAQAAATLGGKQFEIRRVEVVAPGRNLVIAVLVQLLERLGPILSCGSNFAS